MNIYVVDLPTAVSVAMSPALPCMTACSAEAAKGRLRGCDLMARRNQKMKQGWLLKQWNLVWMAFLDPYTRSAHLCPVSSEITCRLFTWQAVL